MEPTLTPALSLKQQTGQMLIAGFEGTALNAETEDLIVNHHVGGFILFERNYESPEQLHRLLQDMQRVAASTPSALPLFVSVDQEGGRIARLKEPFTRFPPPILLDRIRSEELAREYGRTLTAELAEVGINMDYAPVLDVHTNPDNPVIGDRAFSSDPEWAARLAGAFLRGCRDSGMIPVGKHFPGHGDTHLDSHLDLPTVDRSLDQLEQVELEPFRQTIQTGLEAVMTAHVVYPAWDPEHPATFSKTILQSVLRQQLGFEGLIISDDLEMKAVEKYCPFETFAERGVAAGLDVFLVCHNRDKVLALRDQLVQGVEDSLIDKNCIDASCQRIVELKKHIRPIPERSPDTAAWKVHQQTADQIQSTADPN